jgi:hypothetical protein
MLIVVSATGYVLLGGKRIVFCQAMRGNGSGIGEMDANAIGFADVLPIFSRSRLRSG